MNKWFNKQDTTAYGSQKHKTWKSKAILLGCLFAMQASFLTGCQEINEDTKIVLTTGFTKDEVFRIETASCYKKEIMVYLTNIQNQYEDVYGKDIWNVKQGDVVLEDNVKESVLAQLAQIKTMNLMAEKYELQLTEEEQEKVEKSAQEYFDSLSKTEVELLDVTLDTIRQLYKEYAMSDRVYEYIIQDINPEISDDEAREVSLQQIYIRTAYRDANGKLTPYTDEQLEKARQKAEEALEKTSEDIEFEMLVSRYNEGTVTSLSVGKGETDPVYEDVAFNLGNDEISDIIELEDGFYILKCISTLNRDETDANKKKIVEERQREIFNQEYDSFVQNLTRNINETVWQEVGFVHDPEMTTKSFFEVYKKHFIKN